MFNTSQSGTFPEIEALELHKRLQDDSTILIIDVREPSEFQEGHIPQSQLMPLGTLEQQWASLPSEQTIYVSCRSGNRSAMATAQLLSAGYKAVNLRGGMLEWTRLRLPVERS